jgi:hypothetical protein
MKELVRDILDLEDIKGVLLVSEEGGLLFEEMLAPLHPGPENQPWLSRLSAVVRAPEMELVYEDDRVYIRRITGAFLIVWMGGFAPTAMVRVRCDLLIPSLERTLGFKGRRRLFPRF